MICGVEFYDVKFQRGEGGRSKCMDFCWGVQSMEDGTLLI